MPILNILAKSKEEALMQLALLTSGNVADAGQILRRRCSIAEVNAGVTLLPAMFGFHYRVHDIAMISVGGAVGAATTVDVYGTIATVVTKLVAVAIAALTQSALVRMGAANATIIADGGSHVDLDTNTAVTLGKTGATATTATFVDVFLTFDLVSDT